jgi:hypothetical protein
MTKAVTHGRCEDVHYFFDNQYFWQIDNLNYEQYNDDRKVLVHPILNSLTFLVNLFCWIAMSVASSVTCIFLHP